MLDYIYSLNITVGDTRRVDCPVCKGYKTFTVTNNMGSLLWNCYKASCNVSGKKRVHLSVEDIQTAFQDSQQNIYVDDIKLINFASINFSNNLSTPAPSCRFICFLNLNFLNSSNAFTT